MARTSVLTGGSNNFQTTAEDLNAIATDFVGSGVVGTLANTGGVAPMTGGLALNAQGTPNMTVAVSAGIAWVTATPSGQGSQNLRVKVDAQNVTIAANASGSTRWDWIYVKVDPTLANNPDVNGATVGTLFTSRSTSSSSDNGTPPSYGLVIGVVTVINAAPNISNGNIQDKRGQAGVNTLASSSSWTSISTTPTTVTYNGNRNYSLVFNSTDLTSYISNGMRLKLTRTVTAPTQCTSLNGTTQFYSKTSPNGMTFTNNFVVSAWVKLAAYGAQTSVVSRYNGTSGWKLDITAAGQVQLAGFNAGAANVSYLQSYQSIPLNKWVHITAQLDMLTFTTTTTTSYVMLDGVDVPISISRAGTNPTALVQAGNLEIGSTNAGTQPFSGKIAQVAIFSAKVTQATMQSYISQGLAGTETSLISAYSFNNSINDLNANANNLTANGSAVATNADSPFAGGANASTAYTAGTTEFGEVFGISFSTNTTVTVQVPDGFAIPTSGGVSAAAYSTQAVPLGWPLPGGIKEIGYVQLCNTFTGTGTPNQQVPGMTLPVTIPVGRKIRLTAYAVIWGGTTTAVPTIWDGVVNSGTQLQQLNLPSGQGAVISVEVYPSSTSKTYNLGIASVAGNAGLTASVTYPAYLLIELI